MGKPRDIGIRENSVKQLILAKELIEEDFTGKKDETINVVMTLLKTVISHMRGYPNECEFREACGLSWESEKE